MISGLLRLHNPMCGIVWLALFIPAHVLGGRIGSVFPAAVFLLGGVILFSSPSLWETRRPARQAAAIFILLALLDVVSCAYSTAFNGIRTGPLDLWALTRSVFAGVFTVYLIRHYDSSVRRSMETALTAAVYFTLFLRSLGVREWSLFESGEAMGYLAVLAAVHFAFFTRAPLRLAHAAASAVVVLLSMPTAPGSSREAASYFWRSPVFGWGPASYEPMSSLGNQYMRWLLRNGVLGTGLILIGLSLVAFHLLRARWNDRPHLPGAAIFLGFAAGMLMSGAFLEDFRLFALTSFLIAGMHEGGRS